MALFSNVRLYTFIFHFVYTLRIPFRFVSDLKERWGPNSWNKLRPCFKRMDPSTPSTWTTLQAGCRPALLPSSLLNSLSLFWLCWAFGVRASHCGGLSLCGARALGRVGSGVQLVGLRAHTRQLWRAHELSCSAACGLFLHQGLNPCLLHWQADSPPLSHQGSSAGQLWIRQLTWRVPPTFFPHLLSLQFIPSFSLKYVCLDKTNFLEK